MSASDSELPRTVCIDMKDSQFAEQVVVSGFLEIGSYLKRSLPHLFRRLMLPFLADFGVGCFQIFSRARLELP